MKELTPEQAKQLREGMVLKEMMNTEGWKIVDGWLKSRAFHSWVDPRETATQKEWLWQELNAFHSADVARQILQDIQSAIELADELEDVRLGKRDLMNYKI